MEATMSQEPSLIMVQFLAWVADRPRNYAQAMEAWRSSCPRLSVWEDAIIEGLVRIESNANRTVSLTPRGIAVLEQAQPQMTAKSDAQARRGKTQTSAKISAKIPAKTPAIAHAAAL
jgi:hypothetical protein